MRITIAIYILLLLALTTSCEKNIANDDNGKGATPPSGNTEIGSDSKDYALTIDEAKEVMEGAQICVKGYIIASTQQSINNICFEAPFVGSTAIVLSDKRVTGDENQVFYSDDVFPVCLTDASKGIREAYNLEKNPNYWNNYVYIIGTREKYMNMPGLKKIQSIEVDPNHVPEADETEDNNDDSGNTDDSGNDNPTPDDDNSGEGGNNQGDNSGSEGDESGETTPNEDDNKPSGVLTVAQAKEVEKGKGITVKGYIVGAIQGGDFGLGIYYNFDKPTFDNIKAGIILADKPYDESKTPEDQFDLTNYTDLLLVSLSSNKYQEKLNLVKNDIQNKIVQLTGTRREHLGYDGLKDITDYEFIDQE